MKPYPVRLPESLIEDLEAEAEEEDLGTAEYIRKILRQRDSTQEDTQEYTQEHTEQLEDRLGELEQRVDELESDHGRVPDESTKTPERTASRPRDPKGGAGQNTLAEPETSDIGEILSGWPGRRAKKRERRREVGAVALEWLRDRGEPASATDFKNALHDDHSVEGQSEDTWWRKSVRPALKRAVEAGVVEQREGYHDYRWIGERA